MRRALLVSSVTLSLALGTATSGQAPITIDAKLHHLGDTNVAHWDDVAVKPEGLVLEASFKAKRNSKECVLEILHQDVHNRWPIQINGKSVGNLAIVKPRQTRHCVIPAGILKNGTNKFFLKCRKKTDDIIVGKVILHPMPLRNVLKLQPIHVKIRGKNGKPLPAKLTITDDKGKLVSHHYGERLMQAIRPGIAYTGDGDVRFELPPGRYKLWASKGTEWGLATESIEVVEAAPGGGQIGPLTMTLEREVDTTGFVACDTHIHTLTHSGHGDSSVEERMVTLAAEGVELAIATDHNHNIDYRPTQRRMGLNKHFTPVTGNEVTTGVGHFNAFPLDAKEKIPNHRLKDWVLLVNDIRARGAQMVILNHPRWPQIPTGPFGVFQLNRMSGTIEGQKVLPVDALELVNATTLQNNPLYLFVDWFALLNHGGRMTAVGSSDSHTVGDPVGQGRTYVRSSTDNPARINVRKACKTMRAGDTTVSLGIFCDLTVNDKFHMGDLVPAKERRATASLRIAAPSWVRPTTARLYVNGVKVEQRPVATTPGKPTDLRMSFDLKLPAHDAYVVFIVNGKGVRDAFWKTQRPYTLAATNPVWMDVDGDGRYRAPRQTAQALIKRAGGTKLEQLQPLLGKQSNVDDAVAVEAASLARWSYEKGVQNKKQLQQARQKLVLLLGNPPVREVFVRYLKSLPSIQRVAKKKGWK